MNFNIGEALKHIKLGNSFLLFGALIILTSIFVNHEIGLKLGLIIFFSGGFFRLFNIVLREEVIASHIVRFWIWIVLLGMNIWITIRLVPIF